jgi:Fur family zinc uptake transcriptional regulator
LVITKAKKTENLAGTAKKSAENETNLTSLRKFILEILVDKGAPVKAYDLLEEARLLGRRLTPTSVYRVLDYLLEKGLIHKVNALNAYVVCTHDSDSPSSHQPLMLVCPDCQKTTEINDIDLLAPINKKLGDLGYRIGGAIEVHGQCRGCAEK